MSSEVAVVGPVTAPSSQSDAHVAEVRHIAKRYRLGQRLGYRTAGEAVGEAFRGILRRERATAAPARYFWALKDVSFDVSRGEILGIVGRNGAGKSTLLKVLSRITVPTSGRADLYGRIGALLEVGAGFHQELTGRENIYLNGAILGMRKREIDACFDQIVDFAGIDEYLDTPVKRYSSGMYTRLAFAVAAHLETEVLLIDEVLSVGDQRFQEKSLGKMRDVATSGKTVLFVSHNMAAVNSLCTRAMLLDNGNVVHSGTPREVVQEYLRFGRQASATPLAQRLDRSGDGAVRFVSLGLEDGQGNQMTTATSGGPVSIRLDYESADGEPVRHAIVQIAVMGLYGQPLFVCLSRVAHDGFGNLASRGSIWCHIPSLPLLPGVYMLDIWCKVGEAIVDHIRHASELTVSEGDFFGSGKLPPRESGEFLVAHTWQATEV